MGGPGGPEFAFCTASIERVRMLLTHTCSILSSMSSNSNQRDARDAKRRASKLTNRQFIAGDKGCAVILRLLQFPSLPKFLQEVESFFHQARRRRSEIRFHAAQVVHGVDIIPRT